MYPLAHTGGLGDVAGALPAALCALGADVRVMLPMYSSVRARAVKQLKPLAIGSPDGVHAASIVPARSPDTDIPLLLVDCPPLFDRAGGPYGDQTGTDWPDNLARFGMLSQAASIVAGTSSPVRWMPQVLHANDWQTGLAVALLATHRDGRASSLFTIHNLTFLGLFPGAQFSTLGLPQSAFGVDGLEFYGDISLMKAGIFYADRVTTVSPTYAREIQTPQFGAGLDGLLSLRGGELAGILNGADYTRWDPAADALLATRYSPDDISGKADCKAALQREMGLDRRTDAFLIGSVSRLTTQKGLDLLMSALPDLMDGKLQIALLGSGDHAMERSWLDATHKYPGRIAARIGYDEPLSHRIEAGADAFVMPSRFEPCGLNQMYSLRYGTPPIVHRVGGLADSVEDGVTGFVFDEPRAGALAAAVKRAQQLFEKPRAWRALQLHGMAKDFSWQRAAHEYLGIYKSVMHRRSD